MEKMGKNDNKKTWGVCGRTHRRRLGIGINPVDHLSLRGDGGGGGGGERGAVGGGVWGAGCGRLGGVVGREGVRG